MRNLILLLVLVFSLGSISCNRYTIDAPSARANRRGLKEGGDGFSSRSNRKSSKAPQMGFYQKKEKSNPFRVISFKIRNLFATDLEKHKLGNDQRPASQKYNNRRRGERMSKITRSFVKGKQSRLKRKNKSSDKTADSFARNKKKGWFRKK